MAKKLLNRSQCVKCPNSLTTSGSSDYPLNLTRVGFILPSVNLAHYVLKSFANNILLKSTLPERDADENVFTMNTPHSRSCVNNIRPTSSSSIGLYAMCTLIMLKRNQSRKFAKMLCSSLKGYSNRKKFCSVFPQKILADLKLCQIGAFYDLPFQRYGNSDFALKWLFPLKILTGLPAANKISKSYSMFETLNECFAAVLLSKQGKGLEL